MHSGTIKHGAQGEQNQCSELLCNPPAGSRQPVNPAAISYRYPQPSAGAPIALQTTTFFTTFIFTLSLATNHNFNIFRLLSFF